MTMKRGSLKPRPVAAPLIRHVHVKDPAGHSGYVRLGDGDLPWPRILAALAASGYAGWVSLETHWRPAGGSAEAASRHSFAGLLALVRS